MEDSLEVIKQADEMSRERIKHMIDDAIGESQMVIANQAAMLTQGLVNNPDFLHTSGGA